MKLNFTLFSLRLAGQLCLGLACLALSCPAHAVDLKRISLLVQPTGVQPCPVILSIESLRKQFPDFDPAAFVVATADTPGSRAHFLPTQADDLDGDGKPDEIAFEADWPSAERRKVTLEYGTEAAIAPLRLKLPPQAHAVYSSKFQGLGWENDRLAWRLYNDRRSAIDLYGKRRPVLSLDYFARPGVDYEADSPYGRDIFWNGQAMGIGSIAAWVDGHLVRVSDVAERRWKVIADGPVRAIAEMSDQGWQVGGRSVNLTSRFTIWAGQHWFLQDVTVTNAAGLTFVTGLPIKPGTAVIMSAPVLRGKQHRYLATWGRQVQQNDKESPLVNGDNLGLAVFLSHGALRPEDAGPFADTANHLVAISMHANGAVRTGRLAVMAAWDQEAPDTLSVNPPAVLLPDAARSADAWKQGIETVNPAIFTTASVQIVAAQGATVSPASLTSFPAANPLSRASILAVMRRACDYELDTQPGKHDSGWIASTFYIGVMALYQSTHESRYLDAARTWADDWRWLPSHKDVGMADNQACIQVYAELARLEKKTSKLSPAIAAYDKQMQDARPGRLQWWWCDALFMAPAGLVRVSGVTGNAAYTALMNKLWWDTTDLLYDKDQHLFYRDKSFLHKKTAHGRPVFWSRGNGWVVAGIARVLESLPENDPNRGRFIKLHQEMAAKIATLQGEDGLWRTSLLDPQQFPLPETSGTALLTYSLAWGINHHTLDRRTYLPVVQRAWKGLVGKVALDGKLGYVQAVAGSPGPVQPEMTKAYAVGAFLLAGSEMAKLTPNE